MNTLQQPIPAMAAQTPAAPQSPQSQYLAAALKSLGAQAPMTGGALGSDLLANALLHGAQDSQNAAANPGQAAKPLGSLFNMGKQALGFGQPAAPMGNFQTAGTGYGG